MEIGVQSGGSLGMWQEYFGKDLVTIYGIDVNPYCKALFNDPPWINVFTGNQNSPEFWADMKRLNVTFDVILDDGGHTMDMQILTFEKTWPMLAEGGVYICEDTSTSMDILDGIQGSTGGYGGGYKRHTTWIEYSKQFADLVHGHYVNMTAHPDFDPSSLRWSILSSAHYDQMVVLEKGKHPLATNTRQGTFAIPYNEAANPVRAKRLAQYKAELARSWRQ